MIKKTSDNPPEYVSDAPAQDFQAFRDLLRKAVTLSPESAEEIRKRPPNDSDAPAASAAKKIRKHRSATE
jgi:hypothetical protein